MLDDAKFTCRGCGACCRWPGYVRTVAEDIDRMAGYLLQPVAEFTAQYTRLTADRRGLSLVEAPDGACIFLTADNRCRVQPVKPRQCREFPLGWRFPGVENVCRGLAQEGPWHEPGALGMSDSRRTGARAVGLCEMVIDQGARQGVRHKDN